MLRVVSRVLFFSLFLFMASFPVIAREIQIEYQTYQFDNEKGLHFYRSPRATIDNTTISGDEAEFDKQKNVLVFEGNIVVYSTAMLITADRAVVDLNTSINTLFNANFFDQKNVTHGTAERIEQLNDEEYVLYKATLTSCDPKEKSWELDASQITYQVDNFAYSTNTALWFYSIPIFYTPFLSWPTTERRSSGLLSPLFTHHSGSDKTKAFGSRLQIPYFIALDRDHDMTVTTDLVERRGAGIDLSYRYAFIEGMTGELRYWYLDETDRDRDFEDENFGTLAGSESSLDPRPERSKYVFNHKQNIFLDGTLTFTQYANSDNEINKEYFDSNVELDTRFRRIVDTSFPWDSGSLSVKYDTTSKFTQTSIYDSSTDEEIHLNTHPAVSISQRFTTIADTPFSIYTSGSWTNYERVYGWNGIQTAGSVKIAAPFYLDFLNVSPSVQRSFYRYNVSYNYRDDQATDAEIENNQNEYGWKVDTKTLEFNFEVFRYFLNKQEEKTGKLSFVPRLILKEVEDVVRPEGDISGIGSPPVAQKSMTYRLETRYKKRDPNTNSVIDFLQLNLTQPFDLNSGIENHPEKPEVENGEQRLPLRIQLIIRPTSRLKGTLFYRYHHQDNRIAETRTSLGTSSPYSGSFSLTYINNSTKYRDLDNTNHPAANSYVISSSIPVSDKLSLGLSATWDQTRGYIGTRYSETDTVERLDRRLSKFSTSLTYRHSCYNFAVSYAESIDEVSNDSVTKEELRQKITVSLTIPFIPSAAASGLGELNYQESIDNE
jgi:lipopolysaccharide export system protein LptA